MRIKNTELEPLLKYDVFHKYTVIDGRLEHIEAINHNPSFIDFPTD